MTAPAQPTPPDSLVLSAFDGLTNVTSRERFGPKDLAAAVNIDLDNTGQVRRRRGYTLALSGESHSLWEAPTGDVYVVRDGILSRLQPDLSSVVLKVGMGPEPLAYVWVDGRVYYSNRVTSGVILPDDTVAPWGSLGGDGLWLSPVVNPTSTLAEVRGKLLGNPPMATALAYHNGRIYMAEGRTLWATELYLYHYVDKTRTFFPYEADITCLGTARDGVYVGTDTDVWFMSGSNIREMRRQRVLQTGAIRGSMLQVPGDIVNPPQFRQNGLSQAQPAVMFLTAAGVMVGLDGGACYNLTQDRMTFPPAQSAAAMFRQQDGMYHYLTVQDTGGTPSSTARIGDYVDAEIRRFQGA